MKLCKDCKHVLADHTGEINTNAHARCAVFKGPVNPVTGEQAQAFAQNARENRSACGLDALRFEPKEIT